MRPPALLALTPGHPARMDVRERILALGRAGLPGVLLREAHLPIDTLRALVDDVARVVPFVAIHARHPAAASLDRPLHLPSETTSPEHPLPRDRTWGRSCHTESQVRRALAQGASWVFWSPVWAPASKPHDVRPPLGTERYLTLARDQPVWALGGVTPARFGALRRAGAPGAAVLGGLFDGGPPKERLAAYLAEESKMNRSSNPS